MIDGSKIVEISTLKSRYDGNNVRAILNDGRILRLPMKVVLQMVNEFVFETEDKRIHTYLINAKLKQ